ncbi:hypothetical protein Hanom_Chr08g00745321 [Helianthus anomalus]
MTPTTGPPTLSLSVFPSLIVSVFLRRLAPPPPLTTTQQWWWSDLLHEEGGGLLLDSSPAKSPVFGRLRRETPLPPCPIDAAPLSSVSPSLCLVRLGVMGKEGVEGCGGSSDWGTEEGVWLGLRDERGSGGVFLMFYLLN